MAQATPGTPRRSFRELLAGDQFFYGAEIVTTRGVSALNSPSQLVDMAKALLVDERIGWLSVTDNPGGAPMLPPDWLAGLLTEDRGRIVLHLTCKDLNRNGLEAAAWRYASEGFDHLLAITGDYPSTGYRGTAAPVFDLDAVGLIELLHAMNEGLEVPGRRGKTEVLPPTNFSIGCVVSPFKHLEAELVPQYFKLAAKIAAGARWVIPQLGYDMRKFNEVKLFLASRGLDTPVIGNVYVLNRFVAKLFHSGKLPGCVVSDELLELANKYAAGPHRGQTFFRELAAKQLAVFKGLGFRAGYLGGISDPDTFGQIIDLAESFGENDWKDFLREIQFSRPGEFFLFDHDPETGIGDPTRLNPEYVRSLGARPKSKHVTWTYRLSRRVHDWAFTPGQGCYGMMRKLFARFEEKPGLLGRLAYWVERESKHLTYGCRDCGDCSLPDCTYLCPMADCSKNTRNGPCGGSSLGRCELDDKDCLWVRAYERLKRYGESDQLLDRPPVVPNADLVNTSSWANTYLGRDHYAHPVDEPETTPAKGKEQKADGN